MPVPEDPADPAPANAPGTGGRPLRADARRNRDRLLDVAARAFVEDGPDVTLDRIAKRAGVGIGTLYRHFPTRESLIEAAHRSELSHLCDGVPELLADLPADLALRVWMDRVLDYLAAKHGMADALRAVIAAGDNPFRASRQTLLDAVDRVLGAGAEQGVLREDVEPYDVLAALSGVSLVAGALDGRARVARQLDLVLDGLRYRPPAPTGTR